MLKNYDKRLPPVRVFMSAPSRSPAFPSAKVLLILHKKGDKLSPPCRFFVALVFFGDFLVPLYVSAV